jgi:hypothetical protein
MAVASSPASTVVMAWLKTRWRIIVLPDVLAEAQATSFAGQLVEPSG